jgi:hypothetical protein
MGTRFSAFSNFLALLFGVLLVIVTVLVVLLFSSKLTLLNAETYKRALIENRAYEQWPALLAEGSSSFQRFLAKPCADDPLICAMDSAALELQTCLMASLGEPAYMEIGSRQRQPTDAELDRSQACLDGYESTTLQTEPAGGSPDDNPLSSASAEVQACARQALGDETYEALYNGQRPPIKRETRRINACVRQARREARLNNPGIAGDLMPILSDFSPAQWEQLTRFLLPTNELRHITESALDQVFAYLNGESDTASVSLVDLKARLTGQAGDELIGLLLAAQPACTEEQQAQINAGDFENGGATAIYCAASGETLAKMIPPMQDRLSKVAAQIPDEAVIIQLEAASSGNGFGTDSFSAIRSFRNWMRLSVLLLLSLLVLITVFGVRSVKDLLRWWGIPLFIAGVIALSIGLAAQPLLDRAWVNYALHQFPPMISAGLAELGQNVMSSVVRELGKWVMLEAGLIILLGLTAIIASNHIGRKVKETARSFTPPELSSSKREVDARVRPKREDDSGYS